MNVRYRVELSQAERDELTEMLGSGKNAARKLKRAQILLAADGGCRDEEIARTVHPLKPVSFEGDDHLVDRRRADAEVALDVGFSGWSPNMWA